MRTISQAVEEVIRRSPLLSEAIDEGIANNASVARKIRPDVEKYLYEKVSETAIAMALHRTKKSGSRPMYAQKLLKQMHDITVRSNLVKFTCTNSSDVPVILEALSKLTSKRKDAFFNFSRGLHEILIIVNREFEEEVSAVLKKGLHIEKLSDLSAITMRLPESSLSVPGVYYPILKAIAEEGISLVEVMSVRTEFSIIFEDKDVDRAFSVIKRITS